MTPAAGEDRVLMIDATERAGVASARAHVHALNKLLVKKEKSKTAARSA